MNPELLNPQLWLKYAAKYPLLALLALIWAGFVLDRLTFKSLRQFLGIRPRHFLSLPAIYTAPFFHVDWAHLLSNSIPLAIMGFLSANLLPLHKYLLLLLLAATGSGLGVALFGFLLANAAFIHDPWALYSAIAAFLLYGGLLASLFKYQPQVSWAAHIWGFLSGIATAWWFAGAPMPR